MKGLLSSDVNVSSPHIQLRRKDQTIDVCDSHGTTPRRVEPIGCNDNNHKLGNGK